MEIKNPDMDKAKTNKKLKKILIDRDMTMLDLAEKIGTNRVHLSYCCPWA